MFFARQMSDETSENQPPFRARGNADFQLFKMPLRNILLLSLFLIVPVFAFSQNTNILHKQPATPDTSEYQIIYQVDTIHVTKTIIEHDTIIQTDTLTRKPDTIKSVIPVHDSIHSKLDTTGVKIERHFFADFLVSSFIYTNTFSVNNASLIH
jgi:hypothetical protein